MKDRDSVEMIFDRMKLDDVVGPREDLPELLAQNIRQQFQLKFDPAPLEEISKELGVFKVSEVKLTGMEGTIVFPEGKYEAEITLNSNQDPNRKRFTWAHELGHFTNPFHHVDTGNGFNCSDADIFSAVNDLVENEASRFASELLLPEEHLRKFLSSELNHSLDRVIALCEHMGVSKSATIRRFISATNKPAVFIFSRNGMMRYARWKLFPSIRMIKNKPLPELALASQFDGPENSLSKPRVICSSIWLSERNSDYQLNEQVYKQEDGYQITMLTLKN